MKSAMTTMYCSILLFEMFDAYFVMSLQKKEAYYCAYYLKRIAVSIISIMNTGII